MAFLHRPDNQTRSHTVDHVKPHCTCTQLALTGKYCSHLWAVEWFKSNGPVSDWNTAAASDTTAALAVRSSFGQSVQATNFKRTRDEVFTSRVNELLGHLDPQNYTTSAYSFRGGAGAEEEEAGADSTPVSPTQEIPRPRKSRKREAPSSGSSTLFQSPSRMFPSFLPYFCTLIITFMKVVGKRPGRSAAVSPLHPGHSKGTLPVYTHQGSPGHRIKQFAPRFRKSHSLAARSSSPTPQPHRHHHIQVCYIFLTLNQMESDVKNSSVRSNHCPPCTQVLPPQLAEP